MDRCPSVFVCELIGDEGDIVHPPLLARLCLSTREPRTRFA